MSVVYDDLIRENRRRTRLLLAGSFAVLLTLAWVLIGLLLGPDAVTDPATGFGITLVGAGVALLLTFVSTRTGPTLALRAARARPVSREDAPQLHRLLDEVCVSAVLGAGATSGDDPAPDGGGGTVDPSTLVRVRPATVVPAAAAVTDVRPAPVVVRDDGAILADWAAGVPVV